jgi:hypothetical protein
LDVTDGDRAHFTPRWALDPAYQFEPFVLVSEHFDASKAPSWWQEVASIALFDGVEGGGLPASVERSGAYIPLISSGFDGNLNETVTNVQALAEAVDNLPLGGGGGYSPPVTTGANDVQVGDGAGSWIKKTLAEFVTILRSALDAVYQPIGAYIAASRTISTTAPLAGGGDLSANRTLTINAATTLAAGSMSAADKVKLDGVATSADVTAVALPGAISGATAGTTLADADKIPFFLSASSALRAITGANLKTWVKAAVDALYTTGSAVLGSSFTLSSTAGTYQDTGLVIALPYGGTYRIAGNVRGSIQGNAGASWWITCKLYDATNGADVANSERVVAVSGTSGQLLQNTCPVDVVVTVATAVNLKLYAFRNGTGSPTWTTSFIGSDANGRTVLVWERVRV